MALNTGKVKFLFYDRPPNINDIPPSKGSLWIDQKNSIIYVASQGQSRLIWRVNQAHGDAGTQLLNPHKLLVYINENGLHSIPELELTQAELREIVPSQYTVAGRSLSATNFARLHEPYVFTLLDTPVPRIEFSTNQLIYSELNGNLSFALNKANRHIIFDAYFVHVFADGTEIESHHGFILQSDTFGVVNFDFGTLDSEYLLDALLPQPIKDKIQDDDDFYITRIKLMTSIRGLIAPGQNVHYEIRPDRPRIDESKTPAEQLLQGYSTFKVVKVEVTSVGAGLSESVTDIATTDYSDSSDLTLTRAIHNLGLVMHTDQAVLSQKGEPGNDGDDGNDGKTNLLIFAKGTVEPTLPTKVFYNPETDEISVTPENWKSQPEELGAGENIYLSFGVFDPSVNDGSTNIASTFKNPIRFASRGEVGPPGPTATEVLANFRSSYGFNFRYRWQTGTPEAPVLSYPLTGLIGTYASGEVKEMEIIPRTRASNGPDEYIRPGMRLRHDVHGYMRFLLAGSATSGSGLLQLTLMITGSRADGSEIGQFSRTSTLNFRKGDPITHTLNSRMGFDDERYAVGTPIPQSDGSNYVLQESDFQQDIYLKYCLECKILTDAKVDTTGEIREFDFQFAQANMYQLNPTYQVVNAKGDKGDKGEPGEGIMGFSEQPTGDTLNNIPRQ